LHKTILIITIPICSKTELQLLKHKFYALAHETAGTTKHYFLEMSFLIVEEELKMVEEKVCSASGVFLLLDTGY